MAKLKSGTRIYGTVGVDTSLTVGTGATITASGLRLNTGIVTAGGGIQGIGIYSGGTSITTGIVTALNFIGAGNTFAIVGNRVDISIAGGGGGSQTLDQTLGFGNTSSRGMIVGVVTAVKYFGDGSSLTGVVAAGSGVVTQDEGVTVGTAGTINFVGQGVTASFLNGTTTVIISGGSGGGGSALEIRDEGTSVGTAATMINFVGQGVTATYVSGTATVVISGGVGVGTITVSDDLVTNATRYIPFTAATSGSVNAVNVSSSKLTFNPSTGNLVAGGTVTANSDEKLKTNIKTIENALDKVLSLRGVEYDRTDTGDHQIGVIAQEVERIIPEVVYPKQSAPDYETKSVAYGNLIALLIEALKEQNLKINELEKKIKEI